MSSRCRNLLFPTQLYSLQLACNTGVFFTAIGPDGYDSSMVAEEMNTITYDRSNYAQEQGLSSDVGVAIWLYARLSRNKQVKGLSIFSVANVPMRLSIFLTSTGREIRLGTCSINDSYIVSIDHISTNSLVAIVLTISVNT